MIILQAKCEKCSTTKEVVNLDWSQIRCGCGTQIKNDLYGVYSRNPLITGEIDMSVVRKERENEYYQNRG